MRPCKALGSFVLLICTMADTFAVDYRWTRGFAMGTDEAIIRNASGASLNIYCPSGQTDTTPGMFIETNKVRFKKGEQVLVQIVVDGKNHPFNFDEVQYIAGGRSFRLALDRLVDALKEAKAKSFVVEFPKQRVAERFSLLNVKDAIGDILSGCPW
jgi:hypothetical protein